MNSPVFDRGRWRRFAQLLDEADGGRRRHRHGDPEARRELTALLNLAGRIEHLPVAGPREAYVARTRELVIAHALRDLAHEQDKPATAPVESHQVTAVLARQRGASNEPACSQPAPTAHGTPSATPARARVAVFIGVVTGAIALSGVSLASTDALPGQPLYAVKRSSERAKLALAGSEAGRAQLLLEFAHARAIEAAMVQPALLDDVLADMDATTRQAVSLLHLAAVTRHEREHLDVVLRFVTAQRARLGDVDRGRVATHADHLRASLSLLDAVETRAKQLDVSIAKRCPTGSIDSLGPRPVC